MISNEDPSGSAVIEPAGAASDKVGREHLPRILAEVDGERVTIIVAPTGCGKSTGKGRSSFWVDAKRCLFSVSQNDNGPYVLSTVVPICCAVV